MIGNLDENGYLTVDARGDRGRGAAYRLADVKEAMRVVHTLDPAGVGAADLRECLLLQLESRGGKGGVAWQIVADHLKLVETAADQGTGAAAAAAAWSISRSRWT